MKINFKRFFLVNLGLVILVIGLHFFLIPNNLAVGGASGLSMLVHEVIPVIPISVALFAINSVLFVVGFVTIGRDFGGYTIYASLMISVLLGIFEQLFPIPAPLSNDLFINLIFGIFIQGFGMGLVLNQGASTGGTDIVGKIIDKYTNYSFGSGLIASDGFITLGAAFLYGIELGMYALLGVIINALVIDKMLSGLNTQYLIHINSEKWEEINNFIIIDLYRGTTIYTAEGGYSQNQRKIIQTVVNRTQWIELREYIRMTDKSAFMYVGNVSEVEGEGFTYE